MSWNFAPMNLATRAIFLPQSWFIKLSVCWKQMVKYKGCNMEKSQLLNNINVVRHIDITTFDARPMVEAYDNMAFQARNLARASKIYDRMIQDHNCTIILTLAGSLISAGLKKVIVDLIKHKMV